MFRKSFHRYSGAILSGKQTQQTRQTADTETQQTQQTHRIPFAYQQIILYYKTLVTALNHVVSSGGSPTPAGTSVFKHNWDVGMGYLWLNGWGIYHLMG